jgi:hypothetical protein
MPRDDGIAAMIGAPVTAGIPRPTRGDGRYDRATSSVSYRLTR